MISIGDQNGQRVSKWTEKYSIRIGQSQKWVKLNGVVSSKALRPLIILGDWSSYFSTYDDAGSFGFDPKQSNDSGNGSEGVVTGILSGEQTIITGLKQHAEAGSYARTSLYTNTGKHIMLMPDGTIYVTFTTIWPGQTYQWAFFARSTDGGRTWVFYRIDNSYNGNQFTSNFVADKNGNLFFVWNEISAADVNHRKIRLRKLKPDMTWDGAAINISIGATFWNDDPNIQCKPDGTTISIIWGGQGYGSDHNAENILYRERYADGSLSGVSAITADGNATNANYRFPSMDFDKDGYRHFGFGSMNSTVTIKNGWYIQETIAGLQPKVWLNSEPGDQNILNTTSNIMVDLQGRVNIAYALKDSSSSYRIYVKRKTSGGWSSKIQIEDGTTIGTSLVQIQPDNASLLYVIYNSVNMYSPGNIAHIYYKTVNTSNVVGNRYTVKTMPAGRMGITPQIPWSNYPIKDSVHVNVPQQFMIAVYVDSPTATPADGNLIFYADPYAIFGSPSKTPEMDKYTYNIRGAINRTKFNAGFNPSI